MAKLLTGKRKIRNGRTGLVDDEGVFLHMLDNNDVKYFRFSDEAELIAKLSNAYYETEAALARVTDKLEDVQDKLKESKRRNRVYVDQNKKLRVTIARLERELEATKKHRW